MPLDATARAVACRIDGRTVLSTLRSEVPLSLRETTDGLQVLASAFGPLGGDRTRLELVVEDGAHLEVGTIGSQVAQPGPHDPVSHADVDLRVAAAGWLCWRPRPLVVTAGAEHRMDLSARVDRSGTAVLVETVVLGLPGQLSGRYRSRWHVTYDGLPVLVADLDVGPGAAAGWDGPAVTGGARVLVTALLVGPQLPAGRQVEGAQVLELAGPGILLSWLGSDTVEAARVVQAFLDGVARSRADATSDRSEGPRPVGEPPSRLDGSHVRDLALGLSP